jgi:hypothetical protein
MTRINKKFNAASLSVSLISASIALLAACSDGDSTTTAPGTSTNSEERACLLESSITIQNQTTDIKDCAQSDGSLSNVDLRQYCEALSNIGASLGAQPAKITYMKSCPANSQGSCTGASLLPSGITAFYYLRPTISSVKASCVNAGGTWK